MFQRMVEDCKSFALIIWGKWGEGSVRGVHVRKPISLFADEVSATPEGSCRPAQKSHKLENFTLL